MAINKETALTPSGGRDPFAMLRHMTSELDRMFDQSVFAPLGWPAPRLGPVTPEPRWFPVVDVSEKDNRLVTRVDLPGMKREDVKVEVSDGHLTISGERKHEFEEKKEHFFRREREFGSFVRTVPLPEGVKLDDVTAMFADGVLEVSVPLTVQPEAKPRKVEIAEPPAKTQTAP